MRLVSLSVMLLLGVLFIRQNTYPHARLLGSLSWSLADRTAYKEHLGSYKTRTAYDSFAIHRAALLSVRKCLPTEAASHRVKEEVRWP